jgi:fructose/tagatose bisphosphate aldolase
MNGGESAVTTLREALGEAQHRGVAIGHFNFSDLVTLRAIFEAARELSVPVLVGVSEGERAFMGVPQVAAVVKSIRDEYEYPMFLNADNTHSLPNVEAVAHGTAIDVLAPAVGNMHGLLPSMVRGETVKHLDIKRITDIKEATGRFLTLHGGSGTDDEDHRKAVKAGMTIAHISTEIRLAWRRGLEAALARDPNEVAPYKILPGALEAIKKVVRARLELFNAE